jgi:transposase
MHASWPNCCVTTRCRPSITEMSALEIQHRTRSYTVLTEDTTRVMSRLKAVFRSQAVSYRGKKLFRAENRESYLAQLGSAGLRLRAESLYRELDALHPLRLQAKRELLAECRKHPATKCLQSVPFLGKIRSAVLIGRVQPPHRFRTKRQFWAYCGLALETRDSAEYSWVLIRGAGYLTTSRLKPKHSRLLQSKKRRHSAVRRRLHDFLSLPQSLLRSASTWHVEHPAESSCLR